MKNSKFYAFDSVMLKSRLDILLYFEVKQEIIVSKITQQSVTSSGWHVSNNIYSRQWDTLAGANDAWDVILTWAAPW